MSSFSAHGTRFSHVYAVRCCSRGGHEGDRWRTMRDVTTHAADTREGAKHKNI